MSKQGREYEQVVAEIIRAFDPNVSVTQGVWVDGPDGRRELDVLIEGTVNGSPIKGIVECKDFNPDPKINGPVGIEYVDALDSKRRDLEARFAIIYSNAGFTAPAIRKASRVGIGLISVMKMDDERVRFSVLEEYYARRVQLPLERISIFFIDAEGEFIDLLGIAPFEVRHQDLRVASWVHRRITLALALNPISNGEYKFRYRFTSPIFFEWPKGRAKVAGLEFHFGVNGGWFSHEVEIDATIGIYDWIKRRIRIPDGPEEVKVEIKGIDLLKGVPMSRSLTKHVINDRFLNYDSKDGAFINPLLIQYFVRGSQEDPNSVDVNFGPAPDLDGYIEPKDLDSIIRGIKFI